MCLPSPSVGAEQQPPPASPATGHGIWSVLDGSDTLSRFEIGEGAGLLIGPDYIGGVGVLSFDFVLLAGVVIKVLEKCEDLRRLWREPSGGMDEVRIASEVSDGS